MNRFPQDPSHDQPTSGSTSGHRAASALSLGLDLAKRTIALGLIWLLVPLGVMPLAASAQEAPPPPPDQAGQYDQGPPPQNWEVLSPGQLQQLVAPIALYPDGLLAQILAASTYPTQVVEADSFVRSYTSYPPDQLSDMVNSQPWDPSVKAVSAFPSVLEDLNRNLDWTTQLGNAYYNQPQDVLNAVQVLRQQAYSSGRLRSTQQLRILYEPGNIIIQPYNPDVVYVPYYDPWNMWAFRSPYYRWYAPPQPSGVYFGAGISIGFGIGIIIGSWSRYNWGYGHWRPAWRGHPYIEHDRQMYIPRSQSVVNHGYYGHFDRNPTARTFNRRVEGQARQRWAQERRQQPTVRQNRPPVVNRPSQNYNRQQQQQRQRVETQQRQNQVRQQNEQRQRIETQQRNQNRPQQQQQQQNRVVNRPTAQPRQQQQNREMPRPTAQPRQQLQNREVTRPQTNRPTAQPRQQQNREVTRPQATRPAAQPRQQQEKRQEKARPKSDKPDREKDRGHRR